MPLDVPRMLARCAAFGDVDGAQQRKLSLEALSRWLLIRNKMLLYAYVIFSSICRSSSSLKKPATATVSSGHVESIDRGKETKDVHIRGGSRGEAGFHK
jgi:hypothetical protein